MADVVVITGASSGIGRATAHAFAADGARLVLVARSASSLADVVAECGARGGEAVAVIADVAETEQVDAVVATAIERYGCVDVWVGGASVFAFGGVLDLPEEHFRRILEVNVLGQVRGVRAVLPRMLAAGSGTIVLIASVFSKVSAPYVSAYVTSKHALAGFADSLRQELRGTDIRVVTVFPSTIDTPIYQHAANFTGRRTQPLFPVSDPRRVARAIVRRAHRPRRATTVGLVQASMIPVRALAGGLYDAIITVMMRKVSLRDEPAAHSSGNLFEPQPELNAVSGGWQRSGRHESDRKPAPRRRQ